MNDADLRALLASAGSRWRSVHARVRPWPEVGRHIEIWLDGRDGSDDDDDEVPPIARARRMRYREEETAARTGFPMPVRVWNGPKWWAQLTGETVFVNDGSDAGLLLAPGPALSLFFADELPDDCTLTFLGRGERAGRSVVVLDAVPRAELGEANPLAFGRLRCEAYRVEADVERGVLLAVTGFDGNTATAGLEVEAAEFDIAIPSSVFEYEPPAGVRVHRV